MERADMERADVVIVGGGLAGAATAESYRASGGEGSVLILSADQEYPVHRPPLSKEYLRGEQDREKVLVHPPAFYADNQIDVRLGTRVSGIDRQAQTIRLESGDSIGYGTLVLATGARPRQLPVPGGDLPGVHYLRSFASSAALRSSASNAKRAVIIGAGFIGMEVAATLTQLGLAVTVVEMGSRMWPSLVPEEAAALIQAHSERNGVQFLFGRTVQAIEGDRRVEGVRLDSGELLQADLVVAGVGAVLNTELAAEAGLQVDRGVLVDRYLRTADQHIYAVGDIAAIPDPVGGRLHFEHWDNALYQGRTLGRTLAGDATPFERVAYFFSDIFDLSINMVGYPLRPQETITMGDRDAGQFTTVYVRDGVVRAALMVNDDAAFDDWKAAVREQRSAAHIGQHTLVG